MPDMSEVQHRTKSDEPGINREQYLSASHAAWKRVLIPGLFSPRPTNSPTVLNFNPMSYTLHLWWLVGQGTADMLCVAAAG